MGMTQTGITSDGKRTIWAPLDADDTGYCLAVAVMLFLKFLEFFGKRTPPKSDSVARMAASIFVAHGPLWNVETSPFRRY
jgi:hypothetical protein